MASGGFSTGVRGPGADLSFGLHGPEHPKFESGLIRRKARMMTRGRSSPGLWSRTLDMGPGFW